MVPKKQETSPEHFTQRLGGEYPDPGWAMGVAVVDQCLALLGNFVDSRNGNMGCGGVIASIHSCQSFIPVRSITFKLVDEPDQLWGWVDIAGIRLGERLHNTAWVSRILTLHFRETFLTPKINLVKLSDECKCQSPNGKVTREGKKNENNLNQRQIRS